VDAREWQHEHDHKRLSFASRLGFANSARRKTFSPIEAQDSQQINPDDQDLRKLG